MKTRKVKIRLLPDPGRIIQGAFIFINDMVSIAEEMPVN